VDFVDACHGLSITFMASFQQWQFSFALAAEARNQIQK
jgi:hypothetical protein